MPSPLKWLYSAAKQAYQRFRGDKLETTVGVTASLRDAFQDKSRGWAADLTDDLYNKRITIQQWQSQFREGLKNQYIAQYLVARGGRENMTQEDWGDWVGFFGRSTQSIVNLLRTLWMASGGLSASRLVKHRRGSGRGCIKKAQHKPLSGRALQE